jgi:hypothetical protein
MQKRILLAVLVTGLALSTARSGRAGIWDRSAPAGGPWRWSAWYGYFADAGNGWVYHPQHGWVYCAGTTDTSIWFYDKEWGWLWSNATAYPYVWRYRDSAWLWYARGTAGPRYFFNFANGVWENDVDFSANDLRGRWQVTITGTVLGSAVNVSYSLDSLGNLLLAGAPYLSGVNIAAGSLTNGPYSIDFNVNTGAVALAGNVHGALNCTADGCLDATADGSASGTVYGFSGQAAWTSVIAGHFLSRSRYECHVTTAIDGAVQGWPISGTGDLTITATQP